MKSNRPLYKRSDHQCPDGSLARSQRVNGWQPRTATRFVKVLCLLIVVGSSLSLVQLDSWGIQEVNASRLHQRESNQISTLAQEVQSESQMMNLKMKASEQEQGIFDKVINKLQKKEQEEKDLKDEEFLVKQQNFIKATRQAMLLTNSQNDLDDVQQVMKNMRMVETRTPSTTTYEDRVKKIAAQQTDYKDEYEGFGSLTEMIKNQEKLAEKQLQEQETKSNIERMKAKLADKLSQKASQKKAAEVQAIKKPIEEAKTVIAVKEQPVKQQEVANQQQVQNVQQSTSTVTSENINKPQDANINKTEEINSTSETNNSKSEEATSNTTSNETSNASPSDDNSTKPLSSAESNETSSGKNLMQLPAIPALQKSNSSSTGQKPMIAQTALAENKNNNTADEKSGDQQNTTSPTKLYDSGVSEVIDQVQLEQDASQESPSEQPTRSIEDTTTIEDDNQQVQVESQISANQQHRSIVDRFKDKIEQDEADKEKAEELVNNVQNKMDHQKKRNVLDRESERLIREQDVELQLDMDLGLNNSNEQQQQ